MASRGIRGGNIECQVCGKRGHTVDTCFRIHKCQICGKHGHLTNTCYQNPEIKSQPVSSQNRFLSSTGLSPACQICSKKGHTGANCFYRIVVPAYHPSLSIPTCQICGLQGHAALNCTHRANFAYKGSAPPASLSTLTTHSASSYNGNCTQFQGGISDTCYLSSVFLTTHSERTPVSVDVFHLSQLSTELEGDNGDNSSVGDSNDGGPSVQLSQLSTALMEDHNSVVVISIDSDNSVGTEGNSGGIGGNGTDGNNMGGHNDEEHDDYDPRSNSAGSENASNYRFNSDFVDGSHVVTCEEVNIHILNDIVEGVCADFVDSHDSNQVGDTGDSILTDGGNDVGDSNRGSGSNGENDASSDGSSGGLANKDSDGVQGQNEVTDGSSDVVSINEQVDNDEQDVESGSLILKNALDAKEQRRNFDLGHKWVALDPTAKAMKEDEEPVALHAVEFWSLIAVEFWCSIAVEFWSSICDEEIDILEEYGGAFTSDSVIPCFYLIPLLLKTLLKQEEDQDQDEGAWNIALTGGTFLRLVARTVSEDVVLLVMPFIEKNISKPDWRQKEAATYAFGSILEGASSEKLMILVNHALSFMLNALMKDPNNHVKDTTGWTLGRMFESSFETPIITQANCQLIISVLQSMRDVPNVAEKACGALYFLAQGVEDTVADGSIDGLIANEINSLQFGANADVSHCTNLRLVTLAELEEGC